MRILIENAVILTMNGENTVYDPGYVLTDGPVIREVGSGRCEAPFDRRIDGAGMILMPGMVNTHCHVPMIPFRTMGDDCPDRLRRFLFPLELKAMTPRLVFLSSLYGICEMLLSGITTFLDMYYFEEQVAKACEKAGIRGYLGETVINMETCDSREPYGGLKYGEGFLREWSGHELVTPIVAPHGTNTNSREALIAAHELAAKYSTLYTLHVSEMDYELKYFKDTYGQTPTEFMYDQGLLDPNTVAAHCIHMTDHDLELLERSGASVAHCIGSNTKAGKGVARVKDMVERGIPVGLGTDGPSSGNTLSLFTQFRLFASFQKTHYHDRSLFPAADIVRLGTVGGAKVLRAEEKIGSIEAGKRADFVLVETDSVQMFPCFNPYSALVYGANASNVHTVMVNGEILVENKALTRLNLKEIRAELTEEMKEFQRMAKEYSDII